MNSIDHATATCVSLMSPHSTDPKELRDIVVALFREDMTLEEIVKFLIETGHRREKADLPEKPTVEDLKGLLRSLQEISPENRAVWADRFNSGRAQYLCPRCGYAGNKDEFKVFAGTTTVVSCGLCSWLADERYFTRRWTADEQAAYEAERVRLNVSREAEARRKREKRQRAVELEPKVNEILQALEGVGGYENFAEDQDEVGPLVRAVVHASTLTADEIVSEWKQHAATHALITQFTRLTVHEFAAGMILGEFSMKEVLDNIDNIEASELEPLEAGEERFFFTREELIHEYTVNVAKWNRVMDTHELSTALGMDGKFAITVHAKGYAEAHPCTCADCEAMTESNPTKARSRAQ